MLISALKYLFIIPHSLSRTNWIAGFACAHVTAKKFVFTALLPLCKNLNSASIICCLLSSGLSSISRIKSSFAMLAAERTRSKSAESRISPCELSIKDWLIPDPKLLFKVSEEKRTPHTPAFCQGKNKARTDLEKWGAAFNTTVSPRAARPKAAFWLLK